MPNDGSAAFRLTHPGHKVYKTYRVRLESDFHISDFDSLTSGMQLEDGPTAPCQANYYCSSLDRVEIRLYEGRNRQIRRMFEALGYRVASLKRIQFGPLTLRGLRRGQWRYLSKREIAQLAP